MPLEKIVVEPDRAWALWRIEEEEGDLAKEVNEHEQISETFTNPMKRLEWLAGRVLTKEVMKALQLNFQGITKDEFGKPFPRASSFQLSLSHSFPYVAVLMDRYFPAGIDLEQPKDKLFRIASRIHHQEELKDAGTDLVKHCIYWCAKESLIKWYGKKDLIFAEHMFIGPFERKHEGDIHGKIIAAGKETMIPLHYIVYPNFVVVFTNSPRL
jgi:4'-phosphopantetheinyl transferase